MAELQKSSKASLLSVILVLLLWLSITARPSMAAPKNVTVGVILDLGSEFGKMVNNNLHFAVENYYSNHTNTTAKIHLIVRNVSQNDFLKLEIEASNLIKKDKDKVRAILGPQNSEQARFILKLGEKHQVAVIWFPITGPSLLPPPSLSSISSDDQSLNCYQFRAIAATIKALGWHSIIPIYEDTEYGSHLLPCVTNVFKEKGIRMANVIAIDLHSTPSEINGTLDKLNSMSTHVFLVHMSMDLGTRFIFSAEAKDMMVKGYAWILTQDLSTLTDPQFLLRRKSSFDQNIYFLSRKSLKGYMQGALGVRPMDLISKKTPFRREKERNFSDSFRRSLTMYGWWAYHTIEALAMALEKPGTDTGPKLASEIRATNFQCKSGIPFDLRKGHLGHQSEYEVYNVIGQRERIIGSWTPKKIGIVQNYSDVGETSGAYLLEDPLWPGDTLDKPPKLRIGVPRTNFFREFVNGYGKPLPGGFAINVFLKAVEALPFPLKSEFVLLNERRSNTTYDDILCRQMKEENLDAIIGDITTVAHRTKCVDFTLPYLDSSVAMVVRVKTSTSRWILFKPFKWTLWLILGGIFVGATIIIIILEGYKTNKTKETNEFRFNPFLVYKTNVMEINKASKAAGWMVILTSFLFILVVQVYTANLTSILTQGKIKGPSFEDENEIKSRNLCVGYRKGSWVKGFLIHQIRFKDDQLKPLGSREEYSSALSNGTKKGGVDAIFDETPYLTLFLSKNKSQFMMTGNIYRIGGFAFAFPKKSSLTSHFSKAILKVTQDVEQYRVLMAKSSLPTSVEDLELEDESNIKTPSLSIETFGGFYPVLISVVALFLGLYILSPSVIEWLQKKLLFNSAN